MPGPPWVAQKKHSSRRAPRWVNHLGRLHLPLAHALVPRLELSERQGRRERVQVMPDRRARDAERAGQFRTVPNLPVIVRDHRPEAAQRVETNADAELGQVALQEGSNEAEAHS